MYILFYFEMANDALQADTSQLNALFTLQIVAVSSDPNALQALQSANNYPNAQIVQVPVV